MKMKKVLAMLLIVVVLGLCAIGNSFAEPSLKEVLKGIGLHLLQ